MKSALKSWSMVWLTEALADWPKTENMVTRASPTISADAVAAVRRGLRMAFCAGQDAGHPGGVAQRPAEDVGHGPGDDGGQGGHAEEGDGDPTPTWRAWLVWETNSPSSITVTPVTRPTVPMMARRTIDPAESAMGSPRAATGGILDARRAGLAKR